MLAAAVGVSSCNSSKNAQQQVKQEQVKQEQQYGVKSNLPLSELSLNPPEGEIAGWGQRQTTKEYTAIDRAKNAATVELTRILDQIVKSAWEEYEEGREIDGKTKTSERAFTLIEGVVDSAIRGVKVIGRESYYDKEKNLYTAFVVVSLNFEKALDDISKAVSLDEELKQDWAFEKFKERADKNFEEAKSRRNY